MKTAIALSIAAALLAASLPASAETAPYGKRLSTPRAVAASKAGSFDVFVDAPTRFAFVNTPKGWKFTRKLSESQFA